MASLLLVLLQVQLVSHLKKSFLQYSFPSREKHLSVKVHLQSQHWTHLMCHGLSRTLSRNRSTMGFSQLAQNSIACLQVVAVIPPENTKRRRQHRPDHFTNPTRPKVSGASRHQQQPAGVFAPPGQQPSTCGRAAPLLREPPHPTNSIAVTIRTRVFFCFFLREENAACLCSAEHVPRAETGETAVGTRSARACVSQFGGGGELSRLA